MSTRRERQKREARRNHDVKSVSPAKVTQAVEKSTVGRSTFGVAKAIEAARIALSDTLYQGRENRAPVRSVSAAPALPERTVQNSPVLTGERAKQKQKERVERMAQKPSLRDEKKLVGECKSRPSEKQSRSGNGAGRKFVPWCK